MIPLGIFSFYLGRWNKALCPKRDNNEVSTNESLPCDNPMYSRTLILESLFLKQNKKRKSLDMHKNDS